MQLNVDIFVTSVLLPVFFVTIRAVIEAAAALSKGGRSRADRRYRVWVNRASPRWFPHQTFAEMRTKRGAFDCDVMWSLDVASFADVGVALILSTWSVVLHRMRGASPRAPSLLELVTCLFSLIATMVLYFVNQAYGPHQHEQKRVTAGLSILVGLGALVASVALS
jgi:hypothetical protein